MILWSIRPRFHGLSSCDGHVAHALRTLAPVAGYVLLHTAAPRLACVKPAASVHPEPGSNSSLYIFSIKFLAPVTRISLFPKEFTLSLRFSLYGHSLFNYAACLFSIFNDLPL